MSRRRLNTVAASALSLAILFIVSSVADAAKLCVIGSGIGGASVAHFIKHYTCAPTTATSAVDCIDDITIFERSGRAGGRMSTVTIGDDTFEAGASIIHPKNLHALRFARFLNLTTTADDEASEFVSRSNASSSSSWFGIWDGSRFVFQSLRPPPPASSAVKRKVYSFLNAAMLLWRYGLSLIKMDGFVKNMLQRFMLYYGELDSRPVFETVEEMLKWSGLYELTQRTLQEELAEAGLSSRLISELVTVISRINYGQNVSISGLAGAVSLAGSDSGLWAVKGGNWQLAAGLIKFSNARLLLNEGIDSISYSEGHYVLNSTQGNSYNCEITAIATPLDELKITFIPPISVSKRRLQHTFTTFVRGSLNPKYFGLSSTSDIPNLVGTLELPDIPFSSISVLKRYTEEDASHKIFSREPMEDALLDMIFSTRKETIHINWPAYPHYEAPEVFAPIILDGLHLYYLNSFENAASTIETSAVSAENVARLIISRLLGISSSKTSVISPLSKKIILHSDL